MSSANFRHAHAHTHVIDAPQRGDTVTHLHSHTHVREEDQRSVEAVVHHNNHYHDADHSLAAARLAARRAAP